MEILIAEDDLVCSTLLAKIVKKIGYDPLVVKDGAKAWKIIQQKDVKLLITDWQMPDLDGISLCKKIRSAKFPNYIYIIIVTANTKKKECLYGIAAGADDYIMKPFSFEEIQIRLKAGERVLELEKKCKNTNIQLLQAEKMASIGQLAAGVAHEINNPTGFVSSNLKTLFDYQKDIVQLVIEYKKLLKLLGSVSISFDLPELIQHQIKTISDLENEADIDFILDDISDLISESREGTERIKKIVSNLKDFVHPGTQKLQTTQINQNIESCLNIVWNEIKYKAKVIKKYQDIPEIKCYPQQLNQVFTNLLVNAAQAIEKKGTIIIKTQKKKGYIEIKISDTGAGIKEENLSKIFDPFFTTKPVGSGTGLGLHVAYQIIQKHNGNISVESELDKGTTFTICLPYSRISKNLA